MSQTSAGGLKAAKTNKRKHGEDFYIRIGRLGGQNGTGHDFAYGKISPSKAGKMGGRPKKHPVKDFPLDYEIINDDNAPLFIRTPSLIERFRKLF